MQRATPSFGVSIKTVLVGIDFSDSSEKALHHAVVIARRYGPKFYLAHVIAEFQWTPYETRVRASELAREDLRRLEELLVKNGVLAGLEHDVVVAIGDVWEEIKQLATAERADLIVVGTHGRTGLSKVVLGSTAEPVFRHASRPVLTVGPCAPLDPKESATLRRILYPTDFSNESEHALHYALSLTQEHGAELTLLHVVESIEGEARHDVPRVAAALKQRLQALLPSGFASQMAARTELELGPVADTILDVADRQPADLIVLGLKARGPLADHMPWLHADRIVSGACCPVLTIRSA